MPFLTLAAAESLSPAGWIFMLTSLTLVLSLVVWCYRRVLATHSERAAPREQETDDEP